MKKICLIIFFFLSFSVFANELKIQSLRLINTMTYDKNDKFRYSPLKLFDQKDDTAFAFPQKELHNYLLCIIHFDKEYELDEIDIKAGFFDPKWYVKNYRIKEIEFIFNINYYYKNGLLDHTDYGEFFYENGLLKGYIAYGYFFVNDEIDRILKLNKEFCSYYLDYNDKNQIIKRIVATYNGYSAVK